MERERKLRDSVRTLEPGDIIQMQSRDVFFLHYAIAVGDGYMIHLVPEPEQNRFIGKGLYEEVNIVTYCLETDKSCKKDNSRDARDGWDRYPAWEIVERAYSKLRDSSGLYSVIFNNCEKFALWCRYKNQVGLGDQSSTALVLGTAATYAFGAVFGPALTLGAGALAIGAWLRSSTNPGESGNQRITASTASMSNIPANAGQVAKKSAFGASVKSGYRMTKGENPLHTFPMEFGSKFVNGMATEVAYDVGSSLMASKDAGNTDSDDSNAGGVNELLTKSVLVANVAKKSAFGASVKSGYRMTKGENPLHTFPMEFGSKFVNGMATEVAYDMGSSLMASRGAGNTNSDDSSEGGVIELLTKSSLGASIASTSRAVFSGANPAETFQEEFAEKLVLGAAAKEVIKLADSSLPASAKSKRKRNKKCRKR